MSVVLVNPPKLFKRSRPYSPEHEFLGGHKYGLYPSLGLLYLAAVLEQRGIQVKIVDIIAPPRKINEAIETIVAEEPRVIGISATTMQIRGAVQMAEAIRSLRKNVPIGLGGVHITADPDFINRFPIFDFGLVGEGEITFPKLVSSILRGEKPKGIFYGERANNLDDLPFPARHLVDKRNYSEKEEGVSILATRGCPFNCIFCCSIAMGRKVRYRSPENIVDEMEEIRDEYHGRFRFVDDAFTINKERAFRLCTEMINRKLSAKWVCSTRADCVDESLLEIMHKAGCEYIGFGVESGSERVRNNIVRKKITNKDIFGALRFCKKIGIKTGCYLMLGFPTETLEEMHQTVNISLKLDADIIGVHLTELMPSTDLFLDAVKNGIAAFDVFDKYARGELKAWPIYVPNGVTIDDMYEARKDAYRKFFFRPRFILRRLLQDLSSWHMLINDVGMASHLFSRGASPAEPSEYCLEE